MWKMRSDCHGSHGLVDQSKQSSKQMAKQKGLKAMHVKVEKLRRQQIRTAQRIITLREKMTCQKTQSEASQTPRGRTMEPLPKAQKRKAKLRRHNGTAEEQA